MSPAQHRRAHRLAGLQDQWIEPSLDQVSSRGEAHRARTDHHDREHRILGHVHPLHRSLSMRYLIAIALTFVNVSVRRSSGGHCAPEPLGENGSVLTGWVRWTAKA
jgi:hypothetical protein